MSISVVARATAASNRICCFSIARSARCFGCDLLKRVRPASVFGLSNETDLKYPDTGNLQLRLYSPVQSTIMALRTAVNGLLVTLLATLRDHSPQSGANRILSPPRSIIQPSLKHMSTCTPTPRSHRQTSPLTAKMTAAVLDVYVRRVYSRSVELLRPETKSGIRA